MNFHHFVLLSNLDFMTLTTCQFSCSVINSFCADFKLIGVYAFDAGIVMMLEMIKYKASLAALWKDTEG